MTEKLMSDQSRMSYQPTLTGLIDATFSPASEPGTTLSILRDGKERSGQDRVRANLSARQAKEAGLLTSGTYGPRGSTLSRSADLTQSLANKLRPKTDLLGSTLYRLTWKASATPSGRLIFRLRALERRTNVKGSSLASAWPTPTATNREDDIEKRTERGKVHGFGTALTLPMATGLCAWRPPSASDGEGGVMDLQLAHEMGYNPKVKLRDEAILTVLPRATPSARDHKGVGPKGYYRDGELQTDTVDRQAGLTVLASPWATPTGDDANNVTRTSGKYKSPVRDAQTAVASARQTPQAFDAGNGRAGRLKKDCNRDPMRSGSYRADLKDEVLRTAFGMVLIGSTVLTLTVPNGAQLNPAHSLWLMGFPDVWLSCGERATRLVRGRRKRSSKAIAK